jgi:hypothetical protein
MLRLAGDDRFTPHLLSIFSIGPTEHALEFQRGDAKETGLISNPEIRSPAI